MSISTRALLLVSLVAALGSISSALISPCPDLFRYDSTDQPGQWSGTLRLLSDADLHGAWIRVIFDEKLTELTVGDNFGEVVSSTDREYLIKNREVLLKAATPTNVKITVKYEGDKVPSLITYRLNARVVCPPQGTQSGEFFSGDVNSQDFLASILSNGRNIEYKEFPDCGTTPLSAFNKVQSGKSESGQWPWQAAIYVRKNNEEQFVCEATLISPKHLLTSAHCVTYQKTEIPVRPQQLVVYIGRESFKGESKEKLNVEEVSVYPGYRPNNLLNDLSLVKLDKAVTITDFVRPICLGSASERNEGFLVGYGLNPDRKIDDLAQAQVKIVNRDECSDFKGLQSDNGICARFHKDNSVCVGSSGSALTALREGPKPVWELRGVVTLGVALQDKYVCGQSSTLLLQDISKYSKWIQATIS